MLGRMVRFVAWLVAFGWIAWLLKKHFEARATSATASGSRRASRVRVAEPRRVVRLERDPWCGTFVSPEISFPAEQTTGGLELQLAPAGQRENEARVIHFCSAECRARYLRMDRRAAG
jgi:hypothetical protein